MPGPIWSIWDQLPWLPRLFVIVLALVTIYSLQSAAMVFLRLHALAKQTSTASPPSLKKSLGRLQAQCANLRQVLGATFYVFGLILFLMMSTAHRVNDDSRATFFMVVVDNFLLCFAFAGNVFAVLTGLHLVQWFVSARTQSLVKRTLESVEEGPV